MPRLTVPNALTIARLLLVPVVVVLLVDAGAEPSLTAAAVFLFAALTDALDGPLARARGETSALGAFLDPVADKLLTGTALVALATYDRVAAWAVATMLAREVVVTAWRIGTVAAQRGVVPARPLGKAKMHVQVVTVLLLMVIADPGVWWVQATVILAVAVTIASGLDYLLRRPGDVVATPPSRAGTSRVAGRLSAPRARPLRQVGEQPQP